MKKRQWGWYWVRVPKIYTALVAHWNGREWSLPASYANWPSKPRVIKVLSGALDFSERPDPRSYFRS